MKERMDRPTWARKHKVSDEAASGYNLGSCILKCLLALSAEIFYEMGGASAGLDAAVRSFRSIENRTKLMRDKPQGMKRRKSICCLSLQIIIRSYECNRS